MPTSSSHRQRGISLFDALIAFVVLSLGMLAIVRAQGDFRLNAELARQRSEAVRLAQQEMESLRGFAVLAAAPGLRSFDAIETGSRSAATADDAARGQPTNTAYRLERTVDAGGGLPARGVRIGVNWVDRRGAPQRIELASVIAAIAPAHGAALGLARPGATAKGPRGRSVRIPPGAADLGDGRSAFKPVALGSVALLFDNASGGVVGRCAGVAAATPTSALTVATLGACDARAGQLLRGVVRFTSASPPDAAQGHDTPLPFNVALTPVGAGTAAAPWCSVEPVSTPAGDRFAAYFCAVYPGADGRWSGRPLLVPIGWTIGTGPTDRRVCHYASDRYASSAVDANLEHPATYSAVDGSLAHQNFLVVGGGQSCPAGGASTGSPAPFSNAGNPGAASGADNASNNGDVYVGPNTAQHQP